MKCIYYKNVNVEYNPKTSLLCINDATTGEQEAIYYVYDED